MTGITTDRHGQLRPSLKRSITAILAALLVVPAMLIAVAVAMRIAARAAALALTLPPVARQPAPVPRTVRYRPADRTAVADARSPHPGRHPATRHVLRCVTSNRSPRGR